MLDRFEWNFELGENDAGFSNHVEMIVKIARRETRIRAADYDDWVTDTSKETLRDTHGLNGDILVWNHVTQRRHELSSMGIRVNGETLRRQLEMSNLLDNLKFSYHQGIINNQLPLSIGGGIGQSRTLMLLLRKAHLGEVSVTVWPKVLKEMCAKKKIVVLE